MAEKGLLILSVGTRTPDLPVVDEAEQRSILDDFRDRVTRLALQNEQNRAWWFSWLSSRDRYNCPFSADLLWLAQAEKWLGDKKGDIAFCCPDGDLALALADRAENAGWRVRRPRVLRSLGPLLCDALKALGIGLLNWWAGRRYSHSCLDGHDTIVLGWVDKRILGRKDGFESVYFGALPHMLRQVGEKVLDFAPVMGSPREILPITQAAAAANVACLGHLIRLSDVVHSVFAAVTEKVVWQGPDEHLKRRAFSRHVIYSAQARLVESATRRLLSANPQARVIRIYENLPWERAVDMAAHGAGRHVTGYLHCAVLPSHLNYYLDQDEAELRPQPDRIVCTGPAARDVLLALGRYDPGKVLPGMALRGPDPASLPQAQGQRPLRTVLVLLEGLPRMVRLLRVVDQAARSAPHLRVVVRAHPLMPLSKLAAMAGIDVGVDQALTESPAAGLEHAVAQADAVVYQGTTAALTAALMGVPLLWFDDDLPITDDPLFRCQSLKRRFATPQEMASVLAELDSLDNTQWMAEKQALQAYGKAYLSAPSAAGLMDFRIAPVTAHGAY